MWVQVCEIVSGVWPTKVCATLQVDQFLSHNLQTFTLWTETTQQLLELLNLCICIRSYIWWFRWNNDNVDRCWDYEVFRQYLLVAIAANVKMAVRVTNFRLMGEIVSQCHKAVVRNSEVHMRSVRWEFTILVRLNMKRLVKLKRLMSDDELDEDCEVHQAEEWWWWDG